MRVVRGDPRTTATELALKSCLAKVSQCQPNMTARSAKRLASLTDLDTS